MDPEQMMQHMMAASGLHPIMGSMFGGGGFGPSMHPPGVSHDPFSAMMSHNFMSPMSMMMMNPFQGMQQAMSMANHGPNAGGGISYCSSSVTSYTTDQHGRTQVYQQSNEVKQGPDGLKETKSAVRDSRTGHQELSIGHHLREKAHIKKKSKNIYTNDEEECEDFVGIDETEADAFEQNWQRRARNATQYAGNQLQYTNSRPPRNNRLALTSSSHHEDLRSQQNRSPGHRSSGIASIIDKVAMKAKKKKKSKEPKE